MTPQLLELLQCPHDKGTLTTAADGLTCTTCRRTYSTCDEIVRFLDESALDETARTQMALYDERFRTTSPQGHEDLFACEYVYRCGLLAQALAALGAPADLGRQVWVYVGGGEGTQCMALSERGGFHVSFDVSLGQLTTGLWILRNIAPRYFRRLRPDRIAWIWGDGERVLPFRDASADVAYGIGVLNHLPPHKWAQHIGELVRIVKPGGLVFQIVPNPASPFFARLRRQFADPQSLQYWTQFVDPGRIQTIFSEAGLRQIASRALWRFDHDRFPGRYWTLDFVVARLLGPRWPGRWRPGIVVQRLALRVCEHRRRWARALTFDPPQHLLIAGRRP